ncbi:MAG: ABC transporter substrate-binding protein [Candidatus Coatesbacteria bacterium]|nr:MAG: ABC transporter substrate-binding protein [Candidatus Coatesbacteria bacterium]
MRRGFVIAAGGLAALSLIVGCGGGETETYKLGVVGPFTGDGAQFGEMIRMGVEMKAHEINDAGGINGVMLELELQDDKGDPKEAANVAQKLGSDPDVLAVIGHFNSSCSLAGKEVYNQMNVLQLSPGSTNVTVCEGGDWTFRNVYRDDYQGYFIADYIKDVLGYEKVAVFFDNDDYGIGLKEAFRERADEIGLEVVAEEAYVRDTQEYTPQLTQIRAKEPDIIFISGLYANAAMILTQAKNLDIQTPFIGGDGLLSSDLIKNAGSAADGTIITCPFLPTIEDEKTREFVEAFEKKYNEKPDAWAALSYDAVGIVAEAIAEVGTDRTAIRDYVASLNSPENAYDGVTGMTYFDANGDVMKPLVVAVVRDGEFYPAEHQVDSLAEAEPTEETAEAETEEETPEGES